MFSESDKREFLRLYKDASAKVAALPARIRDEEEQAEAERRKPYEITPYTALTADQVVKIVAAIDPIPPELKEVATSQRRVCGELGSSQVCLLSEQLLALLTAAGIGETNAPVQG